MYFNFLLFAKAQTKAIKKYSWERLSAEEEHDYKDIIMSVQYLLRGFLPCGLAHIIAQHFSRSEV